MHIDETKRMQPGIAAAFVGAGMISLLLFPQIAVALRARSQRIDVRRCPAQDSNLKPAD
jgi:hypothetical protein